MSQGNSLRSILYALAANLGIALTKTGAAFVTGSGSMFAEAIHSFADCGNQMLLLWGMRQAKKPPTPDFPMGHGKAIYFWSFVVALMLFSLGGLLSIREGWHKLHAPEPMKWPWIAIGVLGVSIVLETFSLYGALRELRHARGELSLWRWFRQSRQSELVVVVGEDLAALAGLKVAFVFILLTMVTGDPMFDALGSVAIGALLIVVAFGVGREVKALLVGQSAEPAVREGIERQLRAAPGVDEILEVITLHFGDDVMVAVKARMAESPSVTELCATINRAERALKQAFPQVKWVFFEPDTER